MARQRGKSRRVSAPSALRRTWIGLGLVLVGVSVGGYFFYKPGSAPRVPPLPSLEDISDPQLRQALEASREMLQKDPSRGDAWGRYGLLLQSNGLLVPATDAYEQAVQQAPEDPRWPLFLGRLLLPQDDARAMEMLRRSAARATRDFTAPLLELGRELAERGERVEAQLHLRRLLDWQSDDALAHLALARIALLDGHPEVSLGHLAYSLTNSFTARQSYEVLAVTQRRLNHPRAAEAAQGLAAQLPPDLSPPDPFEEAADALRTGRRALIEQCQRLIHQGQGEQWEAVILQLTGGYPEAPEGWLYLGRLRLVQGNIVQAREALEQHLSLDPDSVDGHIQLGLLEMKLGNLEAATGQFQAALAHKPDAEGAWCNLGIVQMRQGQWPAAEGSLRKAIAAHPALVEAYLSLAQVQHQAGDREAALGTLDRAMMVNPFDLRVQALAEQMQAKP